MSVSQIARLLRWQHHLGEAHTLLRATYDPDTRQAVVMFSELESNPDDRAITSAFGPLAEAALPVLRAEFGPEIVSVVWIAHFGEFSYYDPSGPDTFTAISLKVGETGYADDLKGDQELTADQVTQLFGGQPPAPVQDVLARLDART
ncbi:hypothetical protein ABZ957_11425 [Streptomyces sp. NPDC046316]|uniref:hypothetical protein n=1 Tax=unclassified Streptomyces TaxID=2593676 RepID=UPI003405D84A